MIDYINGTIVQKSLGYVILECNNIGYKLLVSQNTSYDLQLDKIHTVYTHMVVKEDSLGLIGFSTLTEKDMFEVLIGVSKIGAKTALAILSTYTVSQIAYFIKSSDVVSLSKISGLGKKTAERLILELKDKVDIFLDNNVVLPKTISKNTQIDETLQEVIDALTMLGFSNKEAMVSAEKAYSINENADVQTIIKSALSLLKK